MPPLQSSHPVDHKLSVTAASVSSLLHSHCSGISSCFTYFHTEDTRNLLLTPATCIPPSSCSKTDASKLRPACIASRFDMDLTEQSPHSFPNQGTSCLKPLVFVHSKLLIAPEHSTFYTFYKPNFKHFTHFLWPRCDTLPYPLSPTLLLSPTHPSKMLIRNVTYLRRSGERPIHHCAWESLFLLRS